MWSSLLSLRYRDIWKLEGNHLVSQSQSIWWKHIRRIEFTSCLPGRFSSQISRKVWNGSQTSFWSDKWSGNCSLEAEFPWLFQTMVKQRSNCLEGVVYFRSWYKVAMGAEAPSVPLGGDSTTSTMHEDTRYLSTTIWSWQIGVECAWFSILLGSVATYPSAGGRRVTCGMRVPRKEYARSRHQRLFAENVGKTRKDAIYKLLSERFESCIYVRGRY